MDRDSERINLNLIAQITTAFEDVRLEEGISMQQARAIDDWGIPDSIDPLEARAKDQEERWQDIPESKIRDFHDIFPFLCPKGFRFYIPAYTIWALRHFRLGDSHSGLEWSTICSMNPSKSQDYHQSQLDRFNSLNLPQKKALHAFLSYLAATEEISLADDAREFLSDYWDDAVRS